MGSVKEQLAVNRELQSEKDELEQLLRDAQKHAKESDISKAQLDVHPELQSEKEELERRLRVAEDNCATFEKELQETNMELGGLKQNLEEAEQIELQNEELVSRLRDMSEEMADTENLQENLKAIQSAMAQKDEMVRFNIDFDRESVFHSLYFVLIHVCRMNMTLIYLLFLDTMSSCATSSWNLKRPDHQLLQINQRQWAICRQSYRRRNASSSIFVLS